MTESSGEGIVSLFKVDKYYQHVINRKNILNCVSHHESINQSAIARGVGLSIPTVMKIMEEMEAEGIVKRIGKGKPRYGKCPELWALVNDAWYVIGVDIGRSKLAIIITDLAGNVCGQREEPTGDTLPEDPLIERIARMIRELLDDVHLSDEAILGIGVAMPGLIDSGTGTVIFSPDFRWQNVPLQAKLSSCLGRDVMIENANTSLARGEHRFGAGKDSDFLLCVNVAHGIGMGVIFYGKPYYGSSSTSGEIGHMTMDPSGPLCACGNFGCLEAVSSGEAIARNGRQVLHLGVPSVMIDMVGNDIDKLDAKVVFDAAKAGDESALHIVDKALEYLGTALADCINLLDPHQIILCGGLTRAGDFFVDKVTAQIERRRMKFAGRNVKISTGALGELGTAIGATCQVLEAFFDAGGTRDA